ncbi:MAG: NAD-dependent epimerase/dehydratase [Alphaproteobacteria bacterium]|nr:NAD-dependent epimerase/dehydratase [Alphaproteobacteria bacterium]
MSSKETGRFVVIGGGGFVGSAVVASLSALGREVVSLGRPAVDLLQPDALAGHLKEGDRVIAVSATAPCKTREMLLDNIRMANAMAAALEAATPAHLTVVSSDAVYADQDCPLTEESWRQPTDFHGMMHMAREQILKSALGGDRCLILRPSLLYGARDPHNGYGPNRFQRLALSGEPIRLFGAGEEKRDHVLIDDAATVIARGAAEGLTGSLNIATGRSVSFMDVAKLTCDCVGGESRIETTERRNPIVHRHFDIAALRRWLPDIRFTLLEDGIRQVVAEARDVG